MLSADPKFMLDRVFKRIYIKKLIYEINLFSCAEVAELVDALGSGSSGGFPVEVQVLSSAPKNVTIESAISILRFSV